MSASRIRAIAEGKLARAKKGHARRLRRKLGEVVAASVEAPAPVAKKAAKKVKKVK